MNENIVQIKSGPDGTAVYRCSNRRWFLLLTVAMLNIANYAHWISFAAVHSKAVAFYRDSTPKDITRILTVSYGLGIPFSVVAPLVTSKFGLRFGLYIAAVLTFIGSLLCCISTFPGSMTDESNITPRVSYWMTLIGQALTGIACPFLVCLPTKISQNWFDEKQGPFATAVLGMSQPIGMVLGQGITPLFVQQPSDIPLMNNVWFVLAIFGVSLAFMSIKSSMPPTPPSRSASLVSELGLQEFAHLSDNLKDLLTNIPGLILSIFLGAAIGYISSFQAMLEPIMCAMGYSNYFSGLCGALVYISGILGSFILGTFIHFIGRQYSIIFIKSMSSILILIFAVFPLIMRLRNEPVVIAFMCSIFGFIAVGSYPTMLELAVEATYPICQALTVSMISVFASIQGVLLIELESYLSQPIAINNTITVPITCNGKNDTEIYDRTNYLYASNGYVIFWFLIFIIFFQTKFHRTSANKQQENRNN